MFGTVFRAIFGNFWLKMLALIISIGIWFYANNSLIEVIDREARVTVIPPDGYRVVLQTEERVRVRVAGPQSVLKRADNAIMHNLIYTLSETELEDGWATLSVDRNWLPSTVPESDVVQLRFRDVSPSKVKVFVSPIRTGAVLPVKVQTSGMPAAGFRLAPEPEASPPAVTVQGPAVAVDTMQYVTTEKIPVYGSRSDIYQPVALQNEVRVTLDDGQSVTVRLQLSQTTVDARVYVSGEQVEERRFAGIPIGFTMVPGFPYKVELVDEQDTVDVVVTAAPAKLKRLQPESIRATVDLTTLPDEPIEVGASALYEERVRVWLPQDVTYRAVRCEPGHVTLRLKNVAE